MIDRYMGEGEYDPTSFCRLRAPVEADIPFIYRLWGEALTRESPVSRGMNRRTARSCWVRVIDTILNNDCTIIRVGCDAEDPNIIFGIAIYQPDVLHYIFVRESLRGAGLARKLAPFVFGNDPNQSTVSVTLNSSYMEKIMKTHPNIVYNPFELFKELKLSES